jgi:cholesterol 7-dehydrogenase
MVYATDVVVGGVLAALPFFAAKRLSPSLESQAAAFTPSVVAGINATGAAAAGVAVTPLLVAEIATGLAAAIVAALLWTGFRALNAPLDIRREARKARQSRMQKAADFPPPFPNGWFVVEHSHSLAKGQVREIQAFGVVLALFRGFDGKAQVLDGICPHLGANLGATGVVSGNCLKCIFHGWEFDRDGKCTKVVGTDTIPANSTVRRYPTREVNGLILVYYDADGSDPLWELETFAPINDGTWYMGGTTYNVVHAHINEIPENGSDAAHLNVLHQPFVVDSMDAAGFQHTWTCTWEADKVQPHKSEIRLRQGITVGGWRVPIGDIDAHISPVGPGIVILNLDTIFGKVVVYETLLPTRVTSQIARHIIFASPTVPRVVAKIIMTAFEEQFNRDVPIWESKKFLPKPLISKADGPIMNFRRWMQQFYSPSSTTFADALAKEYMLDW